MSHAGGLVRFNSDGSIFHFEYNGTVDWCTSPIYNTFEEMYNNWRNQPFIDCKCGNDENAVIFTTYGKGFYWEGRGCRYCMCITEGKNPDEVVCNNGYPDWANKYYEQIKS
jgi:hypothetical protein